MMDGDPNNDKVKHMLAYRASRKPYVKLLNMKIE